MEGTAVRRDEESCRGGGRRRRGKGKRGEDERGRRGKKQKKRGGPSRALVKRKKRSNPLSNQLEIARCCSEIALGSKKRAALMLSQRNRSECASAERRERASPRSARAAAEFFPPL